MGLWKSPAMAKKRSIGKASTHCVNCSLMLFLLSQSDVGRIFMSADQWIKLLQTVFPFFQALIIPVTIYLVFRYFGPSIKKFIENSGKVSGKISPGGIEFSTEQLETATGQVSASLTAASISKEAISLEVNSPGASDNTQSSPN